MNNTALRPSWSSTTIERRQDDGPAQRAIGYAVSQSFDSPSGTPSFTRGSLLAGLEAQLAASSVSSVPLIPIVQDREYPTVIPGDLNWRDHPRWKPLITTPCRTPTLNDPLIPDRSPTPSAWSNCSDTEGGEDDSPGSFIHRRRRKEYVHRAPVWAVSDGAEGTSENDDPFMGGQKARPIRQSTTLPNLGPSDENSHCVAVQKQLTSGYHTSSLPNIFEQTLEARPMLPNTPNWPLSKENLEALPASAGSVTLRPRRLSKNADISILDLNKVSPSNSEIPPKDSRGSSSRESIEAYWSSNRNSHESHSSRVGGSDAESRPLGVERPVSIPEGWDDVHLATGTKINPGSVVICLCAYVPTRGDEFEMGFGDIFTVLKVFDDGWALCAESPGLDEVSGRGLSQRVEVDQLKHTAGPKSLDDGTGVPAAIPQLGSDQPSLTRSSVAYRRDMIAITTECTFPTTLSARTRFLPLLAVTLLCNFGCVIRNGTCKFGTVPTASTLWPDKNSPPGETTLVIGDMKIPDRTVSLQFHTKQAICNSVDRRPIQSRSADTGAKRSIRRAAIKINSEPLVTRKDTPADPSVKVPARSRSNGELRSTKSMRATLKRSFGTLRRRFVQAVDTKPDAKSNPGEPASGAVAEPVDKPVDRPAGQGNAADDQPTSAQREVSLDRLADLRREELSCRAEAQMVLEKKKRQETMARVLPTREPKQPPKAPKAPEGGRLIPRISFSGFSLPAFSLPGFS
ncbi:MAG: hypothetical protein M1839_002926 [Geoglossum umbratile]|nr:MAG: hypothetical protein M1839_002926 [Geoglossum umbratile]